MRVGEVAERAGVNIETLRYYERRGVKPTACASLIARRKRTVSSS
jgi:hypothetical protein